MASGEFPLTTVDYNIKDLADLWKGEMMPSCGAKLHIRITPGHKYEALMHIMYARSRRSVHVHFSSSEPVAGF